MSIIRIEARDGVKNGFSIYEPSIWSMDDANARVTVGSFRSLTAETIAGTQTLIGSFYRSSQYSDTRGTFRSVVVDHEVRGVTATFSGLPNISLTTAETLYSGAPEQGLVPASVARRIVDFLQRDLTRVELTEVADRIGVDALTSKAGVLIDARGGNDQITGSARADRIDGGNGHDALTGGGGNDMLRGGRGDDRLSGGVGDDTLDGAAGRDRLDGGTGNDRLSGGADNDVLLGGSGNDRLAGGAGADVLEGGDGNDVLMGGPGNDRLIGGAGRDRLIGGGDRDVMTGNAGADVFVFALGSGTGNRITDFEDGLDKVEIGAGARGFAGLRIADVEGGAQVAFGDVSVRLDGIAAADLSASDFIFVA
jgi:Ca2+-binding RTX toxin-like protein